MLLIKFRVDVGRDEPDHIDIRAVELAPQRYGVGVDCGLGGTVHGPDGERHECQPRGNKDDGFLFLAFQEMWDEALRQHHGSNDVDGDFGLNCFGGRRTRIGEGKGTLDAGGNQDCPNLGVLGHELGYHAFERCDVFNIKLQASQTTTANGMRRRLADTVSRRLSSFLRAPRRSWRLPVAMIFLPSAWKRRVRPSPMPEVAQMTRTVLETADTVFEDVRID